MTLLGCKLAPFHRIQVLFDEERLPADLHGAPAASLFYGKRARFTSTNFGGRCSLPCFLGRTSSSPQAPHLPLFCLPRCPRVSYSFITGSPLCLCSRIPQTRRSSLHKNNLHIWKHMLFPALLISASHIQSLFAVIFPTCKRPTVIFRFFELDTLDSTHRVISPLVSKPASRSLETSSCETYQHPPRCLVRTEAVACRSKE